MTAPRIVVLDNDSFSLGALHDLLVDAGYRVLGCRPCEVADAHAVLKRAAADLVILDLWLAHRADGWAFLRRLWADIDTTHLPAIIIIGETDVLPLGVGLLQRMRCRVVRKPLDNRALRNEIAAALGWQARVNPPHGVLGRGVVSENSLVAVDRGEA